MKFLLFLLLLLSSTLLAAVKIEEEVFILGEKPEIIRELIEAGSVEIDHVSSEGFEVYGPEGLMNYLEEKNIHYLDMKAIKEKSLSSYPNYTQVTEKLKNLAAKYPSIMKLFSVGKSSQGRDLWVMKISDNVGYDEVEPEFKYISSMHGDEITGRELTLMLIEEMGEKYGRDPAITNLINNTEIFIMPSMNPDGSELKQRANARGYDLNRNFPDMTRDRDNSPVGRQIETQTVMKWQATRNFALSANFHGGAVVANYPWDSIYDAHPLEDLVKEISIGYAVLNTPMRNSREFPGGITNGAAWYVVKGGMQDWSYVWHDDLQITIELSDRKWPSYSDIPGFYRDNRNSMVYYMAQIHRGAGFKFNRKNISGTVAIEQVSPYRRKIGSYAFNGPEFYKVLPEGDYTFSIQEKGSLAPKVHEVRVQKNVIYSNGNYLKLD